MFHVKHFKKSAFFNLFIANTERLNKCRLWHFDFAELTHSLFTFFLIIQKLTLARYIAAIALCRHIFAHR